jgi:hypothetical protein
MRTLLLAFTFFAANAQAAGISFNAEESRLLIASSPAAVQHFPGGCEGAGDEPCYGPYDYFTLGTSQESGQIFCDTTDSACNLNTTEPGAELKDFRLRDPSGLVALTISRATGGGSVFQRPASRTETGILIHCLSAQECLVSTLPILER